MDRFKKLLSDNLDSIIKPVVVLLAICIIIPFALAGTNLITAEKIAQLEEKQRNEAMQLLFPDCEFEAAKSDGTEYFTASEDGSLTGYVFTTSAKGYGGEISVMTAIYADGTIKAVKILDVADETPGLGQNAAKEGFYSQFAGMSGEITTNKINADSSKNEMDPLAGATITSNAVKTAINEALDFYETVSGQTNNEEVTADEE